MTRKEIVQTLTELKKDSTKTQKQKESEAILILLEFLNDLEYFDVFAAFTLIFLDK